MKDGISIIEAEGKGMGRDKGKEKRWGKRNRKGRLWKREKTRQFSNKGKKDGQE